jgi:CheY-like chemotaxis protein
VQKSILIVEFDHDTRVVVRRTFEQIGFFVISRANGSEAVTLLVNITPPSLILLSDKMRIVTAQDFLSKLRNHPVYRTIPVAQILEEETTEKLPGMCHHIVKPITPEALLASIPICLP